MRWAVAMLVAAAVAAGVAATAVRSAPTPNARAEVLIRAALPLEIQALADIPERMNDAEEELRAARDSLSQVDTMKGVDASVRRWARFAQGADSYAHDAVRDPFLPPGPVKLTYIREQLAKAIEAKRGALNVLARLTFKERGSKTTTKATVHPPTCRNMHATSSVAACFKVESWDINADGAARAAQCVFRDGAGRELTNVRPLFKGVLQETTCTLTNKTLVVGGKRKRVVHAELRLTAQTNAVATGSNSVVVTVLWR